MNNPMTALVKQLQHTSKIVEKDGLPIDYRAIPDGDGIHRIDPRVVERNQDRIQKEGGRSEPRTVEVMRARSFFNYNLNTTEIFTKYIEVPCEYGNIPVWVYYPRFMTGLQPGYILVHGGGFMTGNAFSMENRGKLIAERANCVVFNIEYSLSPEAAYPVALTQIYQVLSYVHEHAAEFSVDPKRIIMHGESSGGNQVAACMQMDRDKGTHYARAHVLFYPATTFDNHNLSGYKRDFSDADIAVHSDEEALLPFLMRIGSDQFKANNARVYVQGRENVQHPYISPAFGDPNGLPDLLLISAEYDGMRLEGEYYARKLKKAGVPVKAIMYQGVDHGFFIWLGIQPQAEAAIDEIIAFIKGLS